MARLFRKNAGNYLPASIAFFSFPINRSATFRSPPRCAMPKNRFRSPASSDHKMVLSVLSRSEIVPFTVSCRPRYRPVIFAALPFWASFTPVMIPSASSFFRTTDTFLWFAKNVCGPNARCFHMDSDWVRERSGETACGARNVVLHASRPALLTCSLT